jgi:hypothetical protein
MCERENHHDMAILLNFFNPCNSKRILMNFLYTFNQLKSKGYPVYAIELTFNNQRPSISFDNVIYVSSNSYMFHKEKLYRILEKSVPNKYKKLLFMDADIYYREQDWYTIISSSLDKHECVQPYEKVHYLDLSYKYIYKTAWSCLKNEKKVHESTYSVGFAWAMQRSYYNSSGFYDYCIIGNSDLLSSVHFNGKMLDNSVGIVTRLHKIKYAEYLKTPKPKGIDYCRLTLYHMYHGSLKNRNYWERNFIFGSIDDNIHNLIMVNTDGVFEWKTQDLVDHWNPVILKYFKDRDDDDIGTEKDDNHVTLVDSN